MKRQKFQHLVLAVGLAGALFASAAVAADEIAIPLRDQDVQAAGIETKPVEKSSGSDELVAPGVVAVPPQQLRMVAAPAAGLVETILVSPDEEVKEGDPIATLKSSELIEAQRSFLQAAADAALATEKLRRDEQLYKERIIAERRLLVTRAEAAQARSLLDERGQLLALDGMSEQAIETLRKERKLGAALTVRAPVSGVILARHATVGDRVMAAAPLVTIARLKPIWVNLQIPTGRAAALDRTDKVVLPSHGVEGKLIRIGRTVDPATQSVTAVAEFSPGKSPIRPGQAVQAILRIKGTGGTLWRVPADAVVHYRDKDWVFLRSADGFRAVPVALVSETPQSASIQGPLSAADQVATRGMLTLLAELAAKDPSAK
ncbi:efflux RND transporter periplasmic adaptor subunit [Methylosinus sp. KRF6]|uniref:efflux RND transporter periplasmic adaptor subunit n=1 Tax=Methylosinus sp. KRF6 TaxID=2846853 RepID=UPI001C0ACC07|nr:efflux RND transporter periplasmic adaptor subunit [Methylosinus sp. KRF6]MBU3887540.1 efflux RND transporter periplasmic adaptor subunit [Methylosinus sp. KRF6]